MLAGQSQIIEILKKLYEDQKDYGAKTHELLTALLFAESGTSAVANLSSYSTFSLEAIGVLAKSSYQM